MLYMHYCKSCHRVYMLNGHKQNCPKCHKGVLELKISYMDYVTMNQKERTEFCNCCADDEQLQTLSTTYRMYKYSKWYKELHAQLPQTTILTYPLKDKADLLSPSKGLEVTLKEKQLQMLT